MDRRPLLEVYTASPQVNLQLMGSNRLILFHLSLFRVILVVISGVIIGTIIYACTRDETKEIAVLKLLDAQGWRSFRMIIEQAVFMGAVGTILGGASELAIEPYFPRRVVEYAIRTEQLVKIFGEGHTRVEALIGGPRSVSTMACPARYTTAAAATPSTRPRAFVTWSDQSPGRSSRRSSSRLAQGPPHADDVRHGVPQSVQEIPGRV